MKKIFLTFTFIFLFIPSSFSEVIVGALQTHEYFPLIKGKRLAVLSNQTGMINEREHLIDMLVKNGMKISVIFAPEHGFRGDAGAGDRIKDAIDEKTQIPILSLYDGSLALMDEKTADKFDILIVDIQDVGVRFYTYYSTMIKLMDAAAKYGKKVIILDRPNPNGSYVDGPILDMKYKSEISFLPIPIVHGLTLGELALMANGEKWLTNGICDLTIIKVKNWTHQTMYQLPIPPSPNLPNTRAVHLYPSLCFFEGTVISVGRGTQKPFQIYGNPNMKGYSFSFIPISLKSAKNPPFLNEKCYGRDLTEIKIENIVYRQIDLSYLIEAYRNLNIGDKFWTPYFEKLIGVDYVRQMIKEGKSAKEIKEMWKEDVEKFKELRKPYLLYEE